MHAILSLERSMVLACYTICSVFFIGDSKRREDGGMTPTPKASTTVLC
jgi:hypothetical protein